VASAKRSRLSARLGLQPGLLSAVGIADLVAFDSLGDGESVPELSSLGRARGYSDSAVLASFRDDGFRAAPGKALQRERCRPNPGRQRVGELAKQAVQTGITLEASP
jgi:hypothetical protein